MLRVKGGKPLLCNHEDDLEGIRSQGWENRGEFKIVEGERGEKEGWN